MTIAASNDPPGSGQTVVFSASYTLTGTTSAYLDLTVTEDSPSGNYDWKYHLTVPGTHWGDVGAYDATNNYQVFSIDMLEYNGFLSISSMVNSIDWSNYHQQYAIEWGSNDAGGRGAGPAMIGYFQADFEFKTAACAIVDRVVDFGDALLYCSCIAKGPAEPSVSTTLSSDMIAINANTDNFVEIKDQQGNVTNQADRWLSPKQPGLPKLRDFDVNDREFPKPDGELVPLTVTVYGNLNGVVTLSTLAAVDGEEPNGQVQFWKDNRKKERFTAKDVTPATLPFTVYVEGTRESSVYSDVVIVTTYTVNNAAGVSKYEDYDAVSVAPVVRNLLAETGGPAITFVGNNNPVNGLLGLTSRGSGPVNANGERPAGITFTVLVGTGPFGTKVGFLQNQNAVTNGYNTSTGTGPGQVFTNPTAPKSLKLLPAEINKGTTFPLLDADPGEFFYPSYQSTQVAGLYQATDSPNITWNAATGSDITRIDIFEEFTMYFVVYFDDLSMYPIGHCDWSTNLYATSDNPTAGPLTTIPPLAHVTSFGWTRSNQPPQKTIFPRANDAIAIY